MQIIDQQRYWTQQVPIEGGEQQFYSHYVSRTTTARQNVENRATII